MIRIFILICTTLLVRCSSGKESSMIESYLNDIHGKQIGEHEFEHELVYVLNLNGCSSCTNLHLDILNEINFCDNVILVISGKTTDEEFIGKINTINQRANFLIDEKNHATRYGLASIKPSLYFYRDEEWLEWAIYDNKAEMLPIILENCNTEETYQLIL